MGMTNELLYEYAVQLIYFLSYPAAIQKFATRLDSYTLQSPSERRPTYLSHNFSIITEHNERW